MSEIQVKLNPKLRYTAFISLLLLIATLILWESEIAPLRPGGSWLILKVLPLLLLLKGVWKGNLYTMQWGSMFILLYLLEGGMRVNSDMTILSRYMAGLEILLVCVFFISCLAYLRPAKQAAVKAKKLIKPDHETQHK